MSLFSFSKKKVSRATLVLDIGSKSVGGAIYEKTADGKALLLYTGREQIPFQRELKGERLLAAMINSLGNLLLHIERYGIEHLKNEGKNPYRVDATVFVVSSPWHASETKLLRLELPKPSLVTKTITDNLLSEEEKHFEEERKVSGEAARFEMFERKIIELRLDGYPTATPYGKKAKRLDMQIFGSIISSNTLEALQKTTQKYFPVEHFFYHTFSAVAFAGLRDHFPELKDFLIIQVGGEVTDVTVIKKGIISEVVSLPLGHNSLLRSLAQICDNHPDCTLEALFALHAKEHIDDPDKRKVEMAIAETKKVWLGHLSGALSNFSKEAFLPKDAFLFEESPYALVFEEFLKEVSTSQFTVAAEPFSVKVIDQTPRSLFAETVKGVRLDPILSMESAFSAQIDGVTPTL